MAGGLVGLVIAVPIQAGADALGLTGRPLQPVIAAVAVGLMLDVLHLATGRATPLAVGRQVPREWAALLPAPATAVLYGARLGIGPLTILSTWTWWSVTIAAGLIGPWTGALVGGVFGAVRMLVMTAVSTGLRPDQHARSYGLLRARTDRGWRTLTALGALFLGTALVVGCSAGDRPTLADPPTDTQADAPVGSATNPTAEPTTDSTSESAAVRAVDGAAAGGATEHDDTNRPVIRPATLEDVVRTDLEPGSPAAIDGTNEIDDPSATVAVLARDPEAALGDHLIAGIDGYRSIDDPAADRFLDLTAAADIQPDPTEEVSLLETRGFRGGWIRAFRNADNDVAVATVYEFEDAGEAEFYLEDGLITIGGYGGKFFDIDGMPGVRGFVQTEEPDPKTPDAGPGQGPSDTRPLSLGAAFQHGPRWYLVYFVGSTATVGADDLLPVIEQQRALALATPVG